MQDSTRVKLYMTKHRIENDTNCSDAYARIYNNSLRRNYRTWLRVESFLKGFYDQRRDGRIFAAIGIVWRLAFRTGKKLAAWKSTLISCFHSNNR